MWGLSWRPKQNYNILTPHSYGHQRCVFSRFSRGCLNRRAQRAPLCWIAGLFSTPSCHQRVIQNSIGGSSRGPLLLGGSCPLPHLDSNSSDSNSTDFPVLDRVYIIVSIAPLSPFGMAMF